MKCLLLDSLFQKFLETRYVSVSGCPVSRRACVRVREEAVCRLPFPSLIDMSCFGGEDEAAKEQKRQSKLIDAQLKKDKDVYKATHRLLLLGNVRYVW